MRRKLKPGPNWRDYAHPDAPCRQATQQCDHMGDCLHCGAATGEECRVAQDRRQALQQKEA